MLLFSLFVQHTAERWTEIPYSFVQSTTIGTTYLVMVEYFPENWCLFKYYYKYVYNVYYMYNFGAILFCNV